MSEIPTIKYEIYCKFCLKKTGHIILPEWKWKDIELNDEILGIADSRCDKCEEKHGKFKKM